jgi:hypothetical protein
MRLEKSHLNDLLSALAFCQYCRLTLIIWVKLGIFAVILGGVCCSHWETDGRCLGTKQSRSAFGSAPKCNGSCPRLEVLFLSSVLATGQGSFSRLFLTDYPSRSAISYIDAPTLALLSPFFQIPLWFSTNLSKKSCLKSVRITRPSPWTASLIWDMETNTWA